ncbi:hypothetical protein MHO82_03010 [Vibrio sp. Of7-15]|uniref:hypothetical protein n=1 Tax=Vibrio sp. Of7-15 TaxID=2724879 RepID=UPI001EF1A7DA|nr:hypothetical protein [Vibrio sp. Of7-15]MCG7495819.1 hypothetical protein [Vibrio sp. Of7-15]
MPNRIQKIWITIITLFAMLLTSFIVSAQTNGATLSTLEHTTEQHHPLNIESNCPEQQLISSDNSNHHCCSSLCLLKIPTYKPFVELALQPHTLALIQPDSIQQPIVRAQTLYRPPIL